MKVKLVSYSMPESRASNSIKQFIGKIGEVSSLATNGYVVKFGKSKWFIPKEDICIIP